MSDTFASWIRTIVPTVVGLLAATLVRVGIDMPEDFADQLALVLDVIFVGGYYALARYLEQRYDWARWLLGLPVQPTYHDDGRG